MARKVLSPRGDGKPIGMYSAGFEVDPGRLVFVAGQVAIDGEGRTVGAGDLGARRRKSSVTWRPCWPSPAAL